MKVMSAVSSGRILIRCLEGRMDETLPEPQVLPREQQQYPRPPLPRIQAMPKTRHNASDEKNAKPQIQRASILSTLQVERPKGRFPPFRLRDRFSHQGDTAVPVLELMVSSPTSSGLSGTSITTAPGDEVSHTATASPADWRRGRFVGGGVASFSSSSEEGVPVFGSGSRGVADASLEPNSVPSRVVGVRKNSASQP